MGKKKIKEKLLSSNEQGNLEKQSFGISLWIPFVEDGA